MIFSFWEILCFIIIISPYFTADFIGMENALGMGATTHFQIHIMEIIMVKPLDTKLVESHLESVWGKGLL